MEIGQSIYKIRNNANLTQEQFAEIFGVSQQAVQKWVTDISYIRTGQGYVIKLQGHRAGGV